MENGEEVLCDVFPGGVAVAEGDRLEIDLGRAHSMQNRQGVIDAGIAVEDARAGLCHCEVCADRRRDSEGRREGGCRRSCTPHRKSGVGGTFSPTCEGIHRGLMWTQRNNALPSSRQTGSVMKEGRYRRALSSYMDAAR